MRNQPKKPIKILIRERLLTYVYEKTWNARQEELTALIQDNCALQGYPHPSVAFNGEFYNLVAHPGPPVRNRLHPSLTDRMKTFVDYYDRQVLGEERAKAQGYFDSVLSFSDFPGDWKKLLPDTMQEWFPSIFDGEVSWVAYREWADVEAFRKKHEARFDLICQRLTYNLIL